MLQIFLAIFFSAFLHPSLPFSLILLTQVLDIISTTVGREKGLVEINPISRILQDKIGVLPGMILSKLIAILVSVFATVQVQWIIVALMIGFITNNIWQIFQKR
jgi:hypothetical protein